MSTWPVPVNMLMVEAGVNYAIEFLEGKTEGKLDEKVLSEIINTIAGGEGKAKLSKYEVGGEPLDNFFLILCDYYDFSS